MNTGEGLLVGAAIGLLVGDRRRGGPPGPRLVTPAWVWGWMFLIFLGIPIPALLCADPAPLVALVLCGVWLYVLIGGIVKMVRTDRRLRAAYVVAAQQMAYEQQVYEQQAHLADQQAQAGMTGQAVVDAMRQAYRETQQEAPRAPYKSTRGRHNTVVVPRALNAPRGSTGPSQAPSGPPPPMGSNTPTLWVPTYSGAAKPVQRIETSLGGTVMIDRRSVDPDEL